MSQPVSSEAVAIPLPPIRNDDRILENYADTPVGFSFVNGNAHITFATLRMDHSADPPTQYRQVTLRLVIPLAGAIDLQSTIANLLSMLQRQGLVQPIMPGPQTRQ
jgi:hypothetical protein